MGVVRLHLLWVCYVDIERPIFIVVEAQGRWVLYLNPTYKIRDRTTRLVIALPYSERTQSVSEPTLVLPAIAARTEYGAFCAVEARIALLPLIHLPRTSLGIGRSLRETDLVQSKRNFALD